LVWFDAWLELSRDVFGRRTHILTHDHGVLPLVEFRSRLFGHFLVSLPFVSYGGIEASTTDAELALADKAVRLARGVRASYIELRQRSKLALVPPGWVGRKHKAALVVPLEKGVGALWDGLSSRLRGKVRKARRSGVVLLHGGRELLPELYYLYSLNMRRLGTPVYPRALFERVLAMEGAAILLVRREGRPAAAALALARGPGVELPWISQDYAQSAFNVNEFLYWNAIEWACEHGAEEIDLGRSTVGAGTYRFKLQWKPDVRPLHWYYWTKSGASLPDISPDNPRYALAIAAWRHLPLTVANLIGPRISRNIP
jgi:serine/alanine adding enzyme